MRRLPALCLLLLLAACGQDDPTGLDLPRETTLYLAGGQPQTLDPALTRGGPSGALGHIFNGLVTLDPALQVQPDLAAGWRVADGGRTYTFFLHPGAVFHDGRPVTADDVIFSWTRATDPALGSDTALTYLGDIDGVADRIAGRADAIRGLRAVDDQTLEVRLTTPAVAFLAKLTYPAAFVVDRRQVDDPAWTRAPNGAGPFRLQLWRDDEIIVLARHEAYHDPPTPPATGAPVSHVVYRIGAGIPLTMYEQGEIDLVGVGGPTLARMQDPNNPLSADLRTGVTFCTTTLNFDTTRPPFDDARVRQAFNYALDKATLVTTLFDGNALIADGPLPPGFPGYAAAFPDGVRPRSYPYDPERARRLLTEAGLGDLPPLTFLASGFSGPSSLVTAAVTMWQAALDADITVILVEPFAYLDELYAGNVGHIFSGGWCADYPDPQNFLDVLYRGGARQNLGGYSHPAVDALLAEAAVTAAVDERLALYAAAEARIIADAPVAWVNHGLTAVLVSPRLVDYTLTPIGVAQWHRVSLAP